MVGGNDASGAPLPVGIVGAGKHGARYVAHAAGDVPGLRVAALCRRDEVAGRRMAGEVGAAWHRDPLDLVADPAVRAVVVAAPPSLNASIIEACVGAGKPMLVEKPFATSAAEAFRLRDLVEAAGLPCLVAQTLRFSGTVAAVRGLLPRIGAISQVVLTQSFEPSRLEWLDDPDVAGGGNLLHTGVHSFDLLRFLAGAEAESVSCTTERVTTRRTEDSFVALVGLRHGDGRAILGAVAGSRATESRAGEIRVVGAHGQIVADHVGRDVSLLRGRERERLPDAPDVPTVRAILEFLRPVAEGRVAPPVTARDGAAAVAIADACRRATVSGRREPVPTE